MFCFTGGIIFFFSLFKKEKEVFWLWKKKLNINFPKSLITNIHSHTNEMFKTTSFKSPVATQILSNVIYLFFG